MEGFISKDSWWTHARHLEEPQHANILPRILAGPVAGDSKYYEMLDLVIVLATIVHLLTLSAFCPSMLFRDFALPCFSKSPFGDHDTPRRTKCPDRQTMSQRLRQPKQMPWASQVPCSHSCPARSWGGESGCRQSSMQLSHNPIAGGLATSIGLCIELLANSLQKLSHNVILATFYATVMANIYSIA